MTEVLPSAPPAQIWITDSRITVPLSDHPTACICPYCHQSIVTRVEKSNGVTVWLSAAAICVLGFVIGCCLIPFCIDEMKVRNTLRFSAIDSYRLFRTRDIFVPVVVAWLERRRNCERCHDHLPMENQRSPFLFWINAVQAIHEKSSNECCRWRLRRKYRILKKLL